MICSREGLRALGVIHACEWPLKTPTNVFIYRFQGIFSTNVVQTDNFLRVERCKVSLFQVNFAHSLQRDSHQNIGFAQTLLP